MIEHRNKPWCNQECAESANKRKQGNLLWLQNANNQTAEDLTNIRRDTIKTLKENKRGYKKAKVTKLEENSKNKHIR